MTERVRVAVVEDEPPARLGMRTLLAADREVDLVVECATAEEALVALQRTPVDVLFLDVQLARRSGFDLLAALGANRPPAVVFVTAYDQHAVRAFEVQAVDYLLKPFDDERFAQALERARQRLRQGKAQALAEQLAATFGRGAGCRAADAHAQGRGARRLPARGRDRLDRGAGLLRGDPRRQRGAPAPGDAAGSGGAPGPGALRPHPSIGHRADRPHPASCRRCPPGTPR